MKDERARALHRGGFREGAIVRHRAQMKLGRPGAAHVRRASASIRTREDERADGFAAVPPSLSRRPRRKHATQDGHGRRMNGRMEWVEWIVGLGAGTAEHILPILAKVTW